MDGERRSSARCPVCQGPTKPDESMPEGVRCRMSLCSFNHETVTCPRCQSSEHSSIESTENGFKYTCADCIHTYEKT